MGAECITPDAFAEKSTDEISKLTIWEGNRKKTLGELFKVDGEASSIKELTIKISGDLSRVRRIGTEMSAGKILINGNVGMHLGEEMKGGSITVIGNVDSWAGSMMREGIIEIQGNTGDYVGAPYRGSPRGMRGGTIIIHGNAGNEVGCYMRKGLIEIHGNVGQFAGIHMRDGTIFVKGNSEERAGAQLVGGKIVICGHIPSILPTFNIYDVRPNVRVEKQRVTGPFYRFAGDTAEGGKGRLVVSQTLNKHLNFYEKYL